MALSLVNRIRKFGATPSACETAEAQHELVRREQERIARAAEQAGNLAAVRPVFANPQAYPADVRSRLA
jgi:hypothetical protein